MGNMNRTIKFIFFGCLLIIAFYSPRKAAAAEKVSILIVKTNNSEPYDLALKGFKEVLHSVQNFNIQYFEYNLSEGQPNFKQILSNKPAIVLAIGTTASKSIANYVSDIPTIYSMILDPSLLTGSNTSSNTSGCLIHIPTVVKCDYLSKLLPKIKTIGLLYTDATVKYNDDLITYTKASGIKYISKKISSAKELRDAFQDLFWRIDVLFMVPDSHIYTILETKNIVVQCITNKIALVGLSSPYTEAGALFSLDCDFEDIGKQSGELALDILNGKKHRNVQLTYPRKFKLSLNLGSAMKIGVKLNNQVLEQCSEVFGK